MRSGDRHEVRTALLRDARDEVDDRLLRRAVVPGWQRIGLGSCRDSTRKAPGGNDEKIEMP